MKKYIAYFDILGFKNFLSEKDFNPSKINDAFDRLFRNSQTALSNDQIISKANDIGIVADLNKQKINCLHFSDSIIFWTNSDSEEEFKALLEVSLNFYRKSFICGPFLMRGSIGHGELKYRPICIKNDFIFNSQVLFGQAYLDTYILAESQNSATVCLTEALIKHIGDFKINELETNGKISKKMIQFKSGDFSVYTLNPFNFVLENFDKIEKTYSSKFFLFEDRVITENDFKYLPEDVKIKMHNTIAFLKSFEN